MTKKLDITRLRNSHDRCEFYNPERDPSKPCGQAATHTYDGILICSDCLITRLMLHLNKFSEMTERTSRSLSEFLRTASINSVQLPNDPDVYRDEEEK